MWLSVVDDQGQRVWLNTALISGVILPGPLSPGSGKCSIFAGMLGVQISRAEAERILDAARSEEPRAEALTES